MSVKFEKKSDRDRETETLGIFFKDKEFSYIQGGEFDKEDAKIINEDLLVVGLCEVKTMFKNVEDTDFVRIGLRKIHSSQEKSVYKGLPFLLIWRFNNAIGSLWLQDLIGSVKWGGRKVPREGSTWDRELMIYIDKSKLKLIEATKL